MKRLLTLVMFLLLLSFSFAEIYTIGTGTDTQGQVPLYGLFEYNWSKTIYHQTELIQAGMTAPATISAIAFDVGNSPAPCTFHNQSVYIRNTSEDDYSANTSMPQNSDFHQCMSASLSFYGSGWFVIHLSTPFEWDGLSNIEILWENRHGSWGSDFPMFRYTSTVNPMSVYKYHSDVFPTDDGDVSYNRPNIQIHATLGDPLEPLLLIEPDELNFRDALVDEESAPQNLTITNISAEDITLTEASVFIIGEDAESFGYLPTNLPATLAANQSVVIPVFVNSSNSGILSANLRIHYQGMNYDAALSANVLSANTIHIGSGTLHRHLPVYPYRHYNYSQSIYLQDEIDTANGQIEQIAYSWNGRGTSENSKDWMIYMGHVSREEFDSTDDWVPLSEMTLVFDGEVIATAEAGWVNIVLDNPFTYNNVDNLVIAVDENTPDYDGNRQYFYSTGSTTNRSLRFYSDTDNPDPESPPLGTLIAAFPNIRIQFDDAPPIPTIMINPESISFRDVPLGFEVEPKHVFITNTGSGNLLIEADDISLSGQHAGMFRIDTSAMPFNLSIGASGTLPIYVRGTMEGEITAQLEIMHEGDTYEVPLSANVLSEGTIPLGNALLTNSSTSFPAPYGTWYKAFREQYLIRAYELQDLGGGTGNIESIAFNVVELNDLSPMSNYRIRMRHTDQDALIYRYETGEYQMVFQRETFMPVAGWNVHELDTPFVWDGYSNILVDIVTDAGIQESTQNATTYYSETSFNSLARWESDTGSGDTADFAAFIETKRPNIRFEMQPLTATDIAAISIDGSATPNSHTPAVYTMRIRNLSPHSVNNYELRLMQKLGEDDFVELSSMAGTPLQSLEYMDFELSWTPEDVGEITLFGYVHFADDEVESNNATPLKTVNVLEANVSTFTVGTDTYSNAENSAPTPYGTWYRAFREQYLIRASEILDLGGEMGLISAIGWNVQNVGECAAMPNYRIRLKHTGQSALANVFEPGIYTQVYQHDSYLPTNGWNFHLFDTTFFWNGQDNILVDIITDPIFIDHTRNASVYSSSTSFGSTLRYNSDTGSGEEGTEGSTYSRRPNTRLFMMIDEMGGLSGTVSEAGHPIANVDIVIEDTIFSTQTNGAGQYTFPFLPIGTHTVVASKYGFESVSESVTILENQDSTLDFEIVGSPEFAFSEPILDLGDVTIGLEREENVLISNIGGGALTITSIELSGSIAFSIHQMPQLPATLRSEEYITVGVSFAPAFLGTQEAMITVQDDQNNRYVISGNSGGLSLNVASAQSRESHQLTLIGNGVHSVFVGDALEDHRVPIDFFYHASLYQAVITNQELNGFSGLINGLKLYNNFISQVTLTPIKIWLGNTDLGNLADGWISSNEMELVFDGMLNFPMGENIISIDFPEPYLFVDESNLVIMVQRPLDGTWYTSEDYFKSFTASANRARIALSDVAGHDPTFMTGGTTTAKLPKMTFEVTPTGVGHIEGVVLNEAGTPMQGVAISISQRQELHTDANGEFVLYNVLPGNYTLSFSHYGYITQAQEITIAENTTHEMEITMIEMPKISLSGSVYASDSQAGIAGASIKLFGYQNYSTTSDASGVFLFDSTIYADNDYEYYISAEGYTTAAGELQIAGVDHEMGTITLSEIAYAPTQVFAELSDDSAEVNISWNAPDPDAFEIREGFEGSLFPPLDWSQIITNTGEINQYGMRPTWSKVGTAENIAPNEGFYHAGIAWVAEHQDEWLITPEFDCPPDAYLSFDTALMMGSEGGDHYFVKVSADGGDSWSALWDGASQPAGMHNYLSPIVIDLSLYHDQSIMLAWHADDGNSALGMWYNWFIDDIYIGNYISGDRRAMPDKKSNQLTMTASLVGSSDSRAFVGYEIYRFLAGQQESENNWVLLSDGIFTETEFVDSSWDRLASGHYLWAVKAIYDAEVESAAVFSNSIFKEDTSGTISGFVRRADTAQGIGGVVVSAGEDHFTTTAESGFYLLSLPAGTYDVSASHDEYHSITHEGVAVVIGENTTLNFTLIPTSNEDVVEIAATALSANYPNPFNPETTISYDLKDPAMVRLQVFNLKGQLVRNLVSQEQPSGRYHVVFDARDERGNKLSSGLYFYRLSAGSFQKTRKMMLME